MSKKTSYLTVDRDGSLYINLFYPRLGCHTIHGVGSIDIKTGIVQDWVEAEELFTMFSGSVGIEECRDFISRLYKSYDRRIPISEVWDHAPQRGGPND